MNGFTSQVVPKRLAGSGPALSILGIVLAMAIGALVALVPSTPEFAIGAVMVAWAFVSPYAGLHLMGAILPFEEGYIKVAGVVTAAKAVGLATGIGLSPQSVGSAAELAYDLELLFLALFTGVSFLSGFGLRTQQRGWNAP